MLRCNLLRTEDASWFIFTMPSFSLHRAFSLSKNNSASSRTSERHYRESATQSEGRSSKFDRHGMHETVISRQGVSDSSCKRLESRGWQHSLAIRYHLRFFAQPVLTPDHAPQCDLYCHGRLHFRKLHGKFAIPRA